MKTILVLSSNPDFSEAIRTSLNAEQYRVLHRHSVEEGEPLLVHGLIAACVLDVDLMGVECVWIMEDDHAAGCPYPHHRLYRISAI